MPRSKDRGTIAGRATIAGGFGSARRRGRRMEHERKTVHAVAQTSRFRPIVEHVAKVTAAAAAMNFGPQHAEGAVRSRSHGIVQRLVKARPAGPAFEFRLRGKQRQVASRTGKEALAVLLQKLAGPGPLGALFPQNLILLRCQLGAPLGIGLFDLELFSGLRGLTA